MIKTKNNLFYKLELEDKVSEMLKYNDNFDKLDGSVKKIEELEVSIKELEVKSNNTSALEWKEPVFHNGFKQDANELHKIKYTMDQTNTVYLQGVMVPSLITPDGKLHLALSIPYAPVKNEVFSAATIAGVLVDVRIYTNGHIHIRAPLQNITTADYLPLNIIFKKA